jgi:hypothetical protein
LWSVGLAVALHGWHARAGEERDEVADGRGLQLPELRLAALEPKLRPLNRSSCGQIATRLSTISKGAGADLAHYAQDNVMEPQIPLGRLGTLALAGGRALTWQVVGYVERCDVDDDESSFWREYLLYHRQEGFVFLVDAEDGWSWSAPITGVPAPSGSGVTLDGASYRKLYDYTGQITYVLGEFYWRLSRGERAYNTDYAGTGSASAKRLNRERTGSGSTQEIVWSAGEALSADTVVQAFKLAPSMRAALQRDAAPGSGTRRRS